MRTKSWTVYRIQVGSATNVFYVTLSKYPPFSIKGLKITLDLFWVSKTLPRNLWLLTQY